MSEIFPEKPITSLPEAVAFMGALPMKVGTEPQALSTERLTEIEAELGHVARVAAEATGWRLEDYQAVRGALHGARLAVTEAGRLRAQVAELEHTVQGMVEGLNGHDCPPPGESPMQAVTRFAVRLMEAERLLAEDGCSCPPADHPHQVGCLLDLPAPGSPERPVNELTAAFTPMPVLREVLDGEHYAYVHHEHRTPHDLPELGGAS